MSVETIFHHTGEITVVPGNNGTTFWSTMRISDAEGKPLGEVTFFSPRPIRIMVEEGYQ